MTIVKTPKITPAQHRLIDSIASGTYGKNPRDDRYLWRSLTPCQDMDLITYIGEPGKGQWTLTEGGRRVRESGRNDLPAKAGSIHVVDIKQLRAMHVATDKIVRAAVAESEAWIAEAKRLGRELATAEEATHQAAYARGTFTFTSFAESEPERNRLKAVHEAAEAVEMGARMALMHHLGAYTNKPEDKP